MAKLHVHIIKKSETKYEVRAISEDKTTWFTIPEDCRDLSLSLHSELNAIRTIVSSKTSISKVGGYRRISIPCSPEIRQKYFDEHGNFCINDNYLEEQDLQEHLNITEGDGSSQATQLLLIKRIRELETQITSMNEISLLDVEKKFLLDKFNGKQEARSWLDAFEKECTRHKIIDQTKKIEALKFFVEGNALEWYSSNLIKLPLTDWDLWKNSFIVVYERKNWSSIRTAFSFKYMGGSYSDFAVKKERLLLDADKNMGEMFRIYQIVYALPLEIQDKLDREKIKSFDDLLQELKKFNTSGSKKKTNEKFSEEAKIFDSLKFTADNKRKPCSVCEALGYRNRYHLVQQCRNKDLKLNRINMNLTEDQEGEYSCSPVEKN